MKRHKNKRRAVWLASLGLVGFGSLVFMLLSRADIILFNPKGAIAEQQLWLMVFATLLILAIAVPTLIVLYSLAWEYRESNTKAAYDPDARSGKLFVASIWALPTIFMILLGLVMWPATHKLEPRKPIAADGKPLTIQVVAMRWKWLFIYPEQGIATVNYVNIPVDMPVQFELTADEVPMSSFWIPHLGGQLYAMTGHVTSLNLIADEAGMYPGSSAEINGTGFAGMKFTAQASSDEDFEKWMQDIKASSDVLDDAAYAKLLKPSEDNPVAFYGAAGSDLYAKLLMKYTGSHENQAEHHGAGH